MSDGRRLKLAPRGAIIRRDATLNSGALRSGNNRSRDSMQTNLGTNGVIARELSRQLPLYTDRRSPRRVNWTDEMFSADLLDAQATAAAVAGSSVTYLVAGLKYDYKVWQEQWPRVMRHAIDACKRLGSALVFFDNVYAYRRVDGVMTEPTVQIPAPA
jgi:hypothetical protein